MNAPRIKLLLDVDDTLTCDGPERSPWPGEVRQLTILGQGALARVRYEVCVAEGLLVALRELIAGHDLEVQWLTSWAEDPTALRDLANRLQLGVKAWRHTPYGDAWAADPLLRSAWKAETALRVGEDGTPVIWADDQAWRHKRALTEALGKTPALVLSPVAGIGLTARDVQKMHAFAAKVTGGQCEGCL